MFAILCLDFTHLPAQRSKLSDQDDDISSFVRLEFFQIITETLVVPKLGPS